MTEYSKNIKLYISHFSNIELETKYKKEIKRTWNNPNEAMSQVSLNLEDLNPGESFYIPIVVKLDFPEDFFDGYFISGIFSDSTDNPPADIFPTEVILNFLPTLEKISKYLT